MGDEHICYQDYIAMITYSDSEWQLKKVKSENPQELLESLYYDNGFNNICYDHRKAINDNYYEFCKANNLYNESNDYSKNELKSWILNPINYVTNGHSDFLNIVLLDDFDTIHHTTCEMRNTIEDVDIAFCPEFNSFNITKLRGDRKILIEDTFNIDNEDIQKYLIIFEDLHSVISYGIQNPYDNKKFEIHDIQKDFPLLTFTKFKLMGSGLVFQQCVFRAMALKIISICSKIDKNCSGTGFDILQIDNNGSINSDIKIVFLDLQGREEIGLLIFTKNYSLAASIIAALRSLTWKDIVASDFSGLLFNSLDKELFEQLNFKIALSNSQNLPSGELSFNDNHVFRWSFSTNGISPLHCIYPEKLAKNCLISAITELQILPGHNSDVSNNIAEKPEEKSSNIKNVNIKKEDYFLYHIGISDYLFTNKEINYNEEVSPNLVSLESFIRILNRNLTTFGANNYLNSRGRHIHNYSTRIAIPIPKFLDGYINVKIGKNHLSLLSQSLALLKNRLFYFSDLTDQEKEKVSKKLNPGKLDIKKLKRRPRLYGLPVSLRRNIEYIFQNFAIFFGNPYMYDSVIDLFDTFVTLHRVLTDYFYHEYLEIQKTYGEEKLVYIEGDKIRQLATLVEVVHDAFIHRTTNPYPESEYREMSIDFRGDLNQMIYAADSPVKCVLFLLQKYLDKGDGKNNCVGAIGKIGFNPGASCLPFNFNLDDKIKLASFEFDVPHVFHVSSYIDNMHESIHLLFDTFIKQGKFNKSINDLFINPKQLVMQGRINELFTLLLCHLLIFGNNKQKFLYYHITNYSKISSSSEGKDDEIIIKFTEYFLRIFIVQYIIPEKQTMYYEIEDFSLQRLHDTELALKNFISIIDKYGVLFSDFDRLKRKSRFVEYYLTHFKIIYPLVIPFFNDLINKALDVYKIYIDNSLHGNTILKDSDINSIIQNSLKNGMPIPISELYSINEPKERGNFASLLLISNFLLNNSTDPIFEDLFSKNIHLIRDSKERKVSYPKNQKTWFEFQIDKGSAQMFCPVPQKRSERLKKQIVILKSFWDISNLQRNNILKEIVTDNWCEE